jgi:ribosomal protein L37AE/L43A
MQRRIKWLIIGVILIATAVGLIIIKTSLEQKISTGTYQLSAFKTIIINYADWITVSLIIVGSISLLWGSRRRNLFNVRNDLKKASKLAAKSLRLCPTCHRTQFYVESNQAWYCFECKKYEQSGALENQAKRDVPVEPISLKVQTDKVIKIKKPKQKRRPKIQTEKIKHQTDQIQQPLSKEFVCPRNLDYFSQHPRPKVVPTECISCKNLIQCVCITST